MPDGRGDGEPSIRRTEHLQERGRRYLFPKTPRVDIPRVVSRRIQNNRKKPRWWYGVRSGSVKSESTKTVIIKAATNECLALWLRPLGRPKDKRSDQVGRESVFHESLGNRSGVGNTLSESRA